MQTISFAVSFYIPPFFEFGDPFGCSVHTEDTTLYGAKLFTIPHKDIAENEAFAIVSGIFDSYAPHQQAVAVDSNGYAGKQGHIVLTLHNVQARCIPGTYLFDLIHPVC